MASFIKRLTPLADRVLVRRLKAAEKVGNVYIPEIASAKKNFVEAEVVAVGPGSRARNDGSLIPVSVKPGDTVVVSSLPSGTPIQISNEELILYYESDILGIVEKS